MKLKTKRLLAAALALSLTANISLAAFAVTYDIDDGDVYISGDEDGNISSWQTEDNVSNDTTIIIVQGEDAVAAVKDIDITANSDDSPYETAEDVADAVSDALANMEDSETSTTHDVTISGDVSGADIIISNVDLEVTDDGESEVDAAVTVNSGAIVDDLIIQDTSIAVDTDHAAGVFVDDGASANITLSGNNDIVLNGATTSGIQVGTDESASETNVELTVDGTTTISKSEALDNTTYGSGNNTAGISVGGNASDGEGNGNATLTITGGDDDANLNINGTAEGILVHGGDSKLYIGGEDETEDTINVTIDGSALTADGGDGGLFNYSGSGRGLISYGVTTIRNGASLTVNNSNTYGISIFSNDLTIDSGAQVTVNNSKNDGIYAEKGAGIVVSGEGTSLTVNDANSGYGITIQGTGNTEGETDLTVSDGATVAVNDSKAGIRVTNGGSVKIEGNNADNQTSININNSGTGVYIENNATDANAELLVTGNALLNVTNDTSVTQTLTYGIVAQNTDITVEDGAQIILDGAVSGDGIYLSGSNAAKMLVTGEGTLVEIKNYGNMSEASLYVIANKSIVIEDNATVKIDGTQSNGLYLNGNDTNLIVDNATLEMDGSRIVIAGTKDEETSLPHIEVRNGSRVVTSYVYDWAQNGGDIWITGGTVELTSDRSSGSNWVGSTDSENLLTMSDKTIWPTSGEENGDEKLTGFKLSVSELKTLQDELWAENEDLSAEEFFEKYGFLIEYEDGVPTTLTFQTYGYKNGEYYNYNADKANGTTSDWYVVDLTKGYDGELWVWTPAVVLSYFELNEGNTLSNAVSSDEFDPDEVTVGDELTEYDYHDVVVRGQSIDFGNFQTNKDYATIKLIDDNGEETTAYAIAKAAADGKGITLYIYDAMDEGEAAGTVSEEDLEDKTIIVQGEDGKYYLADSNGKYLTNDDGENIATGTYYYAVTDADGNFIRVKTNDAGYIVLDENGNFILDDDGAYVYTDEDGNLLNVELDSTPTDTVRIIVSGTGYALPNADGTYSSTDADGNPVTAETEGAVEVATAVYYYAQVDEEGNYITDAEGNYVYEDENGNVLSSTNSIEFVLVLLGDDETYVLYEDGKLYLVNANGEKTVVVNGEKIDLASLWEEFTSTTRVRSNAQAGGKTYNFENIFGGKGKTVTLLTADPSKVNVVVEEEEPGDTDEPGDDEPDPTPNPDPNPDDHEPIVPAPVVPTDPSTPAQPETPAETPTETPAETPADPEAPAAPAEPATPASSTPKTGDDSNVAIYLVMAALSGAALIGLGVTGKKKNEEV